MIKDFAYRQVHSTEEACAVLTEHGDEAKLLAGGNALLILMKERLVTPSVVVDIEAIPGLDQIHYQAGVGFEVGALTTLRQMERSEVIRAHCPVLARTVSLVGSSKVRNTATLGGNLCHADPASDPPALMVALEATFTLVGPRGERRVPAAEFFTDFYTTTLGHDEVMTRIHIPELPGGSRATYLKFTPRSVMDYAVVGIAALFHTDGGGVVQDIRLGLTGVAPAAFRARGAEACLRGQRLTAEGLKEAGRLASEQSSPISDVRGSAAYRREMVAVLVEEVLSELAGEVPRA